MPQMKRLARLGLDAVLAAFGGWIIGFIFAGVLKPNILTPGDAHFQTAVRLTRRGNRGGLVAGDGRRNGGNILPGLRPYQFAQRGISRTFQNIRLFGDLTVLENVRIGNYCRRRTGLFDGLFQTARLAREEQVSIAHARELLARFNLLRVENEAAKNLPVWRPAAA